MNMRKITWIAWRCSLAGILVGLVGGCSRPVREPQVAVEMPDSFSTTGSAPLPQQWWRTLEDEELHALIEQAITNSFTLQTAWDRLAQAHAVARQTDATLSPQADLQAGASRIRREDDMGTSYSSLYFVGVAAGYEVDLWSRLGSAQKAAWLDVQVSREALDAAAITLSATIANTWYQLAEAKAVCHIAREQIETNKKVLDIVTVRFRKGLASAADVLRQRQLVTSTEATLISAQETVAILQYALSVLIGEAPESRWEENVIEFPELPALPDLGVPSELLQRRPDIRQAYRRVQAADQRLAVAIADQYPRLSISAGAEMSSVSMRDLLDDWLANLAANAVQPLFDAGRRKAEVQRQRALVRESIHTWSQAILEALREVETALFQERQQTQLLENLDAQLRLARQTYERNEQSFLKGQVDYIRVLESLQSLQRLELNVVTAQRTLVTRRIDLYRSIAGPCDLPAPALVQIDSLMQPTQNSENTVQAD